MQYFYTKDAFTFCWCMEMPQKKTVYWRPSNFVILNIKRRTIFFLWSQKDCLSQQELLPVQYYHRPVRLPQWNGPGPLVGVVASLSTYSGVERVFLDELAKLLGAT